MTAEEVTALRAELWARGWRPVPVVNHTAGGQSPGKRPLGKGWREAALADPPYGACHEAVDHALNTGILADGLRVIDLDIEDRALVDRIVAECERLFGPAPLRYRANSARSLLVYRATHGEPAKIVLSGDHGKVEVLGAGQQFVAFGTHESGATLEWSAPLDMVARSSVPAVSEAQIATLLRNVAPWLGASAPSAEVRPTSDAPPPDFARLRAAVLAVPNDVRFNAWEAWNRFGMALFAASEGSADGLELWHEWSQRHPSYDPEATTARWLAYTGSPPSQLTARTIFYEARRAGFVESMAPTDEKPGGLANAFDAGSLADLQPYDWLYGWFICRGYMSLIGAPSGVGKTAYLMHVAIAISLGRGILNERVTEGRRRKVWVINGEDDTAHLKKLLWACCLYHRIDPAELTGWIHLTGAENDRVLMTVLVDGQPVRTPIYERVCEYVLDHEIEYLSADPIVDTHALDENSNVEMNFATKAWYDLARDLQIGVAMSHHLRKGGQGGDQDAFRGAAAIMAKSRVARMLSVMTPLEAEKLGVSEEDRRWHLRMDNPKANIAPPVSDAHWLRLESVQLPNRVMRDGVEVQDDIQALRRWTPPTPFDGLEWQDIGKILEAISEGPEPGEMWSANRRGRSAERWVGNAFPGDLGKTDAQKSALIAAWLASGLLETGEYHSPKQRRELQGVIVNQAKFQEMRREWVSKNTQDG